MKSRIYQLCVTAFVAIASVVSAPAVLRADEGSSRWRPYIEAGPTGLVNVGFSSGGGGAAVGGGIDSRWFGIGTKLRAEYLSGGLDEEISGGGVYQWDVAELRLYVADWFHEDPWKFQPYLLGNGGFNVSNDDGFGFQLGLGAGTRYHLNDRVYLALEATVREVFAASTIGVGFGGSGMIGYRF
jgi:hypothetical protein